MASDENISLEQFCWLIESGRELLLGQGTCPPKEFDVGKLTSGRLEPWQTSLLQQQVGLRWRSRTRFPRPELWLWTERSLSQASDYWSARYKASLFPAGQVVMDACCGAGADLVALARRGEVVGVDGDARLKQLSQDNARAHGYQVQVTSEEIVSGWQVPGDWLNIDPDRRATGRRTNAADEFSPTLEDVLAIAEVTRGAIVKLAPSTRINDELLTRMEAIGQRVWLGNQGECRQQLLLTGELARASMRMAVLCEPDENNQVNDEYSGYPEYSLDWLEKPGRYVFDLHSVLHAAELQTAWAGQHNLRCLGSPHGFFTGDAPLNSPWTQMFEVLEVLSWDDRQIRKWLRKRQVGVVEVKTRGLLDHSINIDANACQRRYSAAQGEPVTLLVTRLAGRVRGIVARRLVS